MKQSQIWKLLQNKLVLAAMLMVLVAGTATAGVMALRNRASGEQDEEKDPGYAFQTEEPLQGQDQLLQVPEPEGQTGSLDPDAVGSLQRPDREENDPKQEEPSAADRPVQSGDVEVISGQDEDMKEEAPAETLVSADDAVIYTPETEEAIAPVDALEFAASSTMGWPVFGNIILDYSMDTTIYFPTLEQYKCNPGIVIQAELGQPVLAAARGKVTAIGENEEWGRFIMMDLGGDYSLIYGQLEGVTVSIGQIVEAGETLAVVAQPTKYYVVEGPNVYLEMRWNQYPVDPLDHIR